MKVNLERLETLLDLENELAQILTMIHADYCGKATHDRVCQKASGAYHRMSALNKSILDEKRQAEEQTEQLVWDGNNGKLA